MSSDRSKTTGVELLEQQLGWSEKLLGKQPDIIDGCGAQYNRVIRGLSSDLWLGSIEGLVVGKCQ